MTTTNVPVPFHRLLAVETRKLVDTRVSKILLAVLFVLTVVAVGARSVVAGPHLFRVLGTAGVGYGTLLPVIGILSVTSEWSRRTALTTFTLEPRRARLLVAKCVPPLLLAVAASAFAVLVAVPATVIASRVSGVAVDWDVTPYALLGWTVTIVLFTASGVALGMLLLNAPAAIVVCLSTAVLWSGVSRLGRVGSTLAEWLDLNTTTAPVAHGHLDGGDAARLATSVAFWIVVPLAVGVLRNARREIR